MEGAGDVPQCTIPTGDKGGNGGAQPGGKVGSAGPKEGAEDGDEVEEAATARREASEEAPVQACEQSMSSTDDAPSHTRGMRVLARKRKRGRSWLSSL